LSSLWQCAGVVDDIGKGKSVVLDMRHSETLRAV
jgi:hypothetical protein